MASFAYTNLICNLLAFFALGSAILTISVGNNNPVNAVLWLIVSFVAVACYLITLLGGLYLFCLELITPAGG